MMLPRLALCLLSLVLISGTGCNRSDIVPVKGKVTRGGQPVGNVVIWFTPAEGRPSWALSDAEGNFELEYNRDRKGAKVSKHRVTVKYEPRPTDPGEEQLILSGRKPRPTRPPEMDAILAKYGPAASTLEVDVAKGVSDLELKLD